MKKKNFEMLLFLMIIIFLLIVIYLNFINKKKEAFTSGFREMFRPIYRNVRLNIENKYTYIKKNINLFFRKFGLI
jgi:competence protein ComGC